MIKEKAYAKVNLFLNVVNKRFDGYHDLEMVMASLKLHDKLSFELNKTSEIIIKSETVITEDVKDNIVYKIAEFLQEEFEISKGAIITIKKNIPIAAGLAGGSADAAATFRGLNKLWKLKLSLGDMAKLGINFGADIPFCIYNKLCIAKGKGEEIVFLNQKLNYKVLLVYPNVKVSTKEVFSKVKPENLKEIKISNMSNAIYNKNFTLITKELYNSLEPIVFEMYPKIKEMKHHFIELGLNAALMSGSGSSVFALSNDKKRLDYVYETISDSYFKTFTKLR